MNDKVKCNNGSSPAIPAIPAIGHNIWPANVVFNISFYQMYMMVCVGGWLSMLVCVHLIMKNHPLMATNIRCVEEYVPDKMIAKNYLPIVSTAVGHHQPNRAIWSFIIGLNGLPNVVHAIIYHAHFTAWYRRVCGTVPGGTAWYRRALLPALVYITPLATVTEYLVGLHGLTMISTEDNFPVHEQLTTAFCVSGLLHMFLHCALVYLSTAAPAGHSNTLTRLKHRVTTDKWLAPWSLKLKLLLSVTVILGNLTGLVSYVLHARYCWDGVYTPFAVCEYVTITSAILFTLTICLDFRGYRFVVRGPQRRVDKTINMSSKCQ